MKKMKISIGMYKVTIDLMNVLKLLQTTMAIEVLQIDSDEVGGFNFTLSGGYKLEVFPDSSEDDEQSEYWRLFNRKENNPHFIVTGNGIEKV
jgi:hypothetical protein